MRLILNASRARLSDEEIDPLEQDDFDSVSSFQGDGWLLWDVDDLIDIRRIIDERMPSKEKQIIDAFLNGMNYKDMDVSEKYWRYHYEKAIEFIKKEMSL